MQLLQTGAAMLPFDAAAADTIRALSLMEPQRMTAAMALAHGTMMNPNVRATSYTTRCDYGPKFNLKVEMVT